MSESRPTIQTRYPSPGGRKIQMFLAMLELTSSLDKVGGPFRESIHGGLGMCAENVREDASVHDSEISDALDRKIGIEDTVLCSFPSDGSGSYRMPNGHRVVPHIFGQCGGCAGICKVPICTKDIAFHGWSGDDGFESFQT